MKHLLAILLLLSRVVWARDAGSFATKEFYQIEQMTNSVFQGVQPQEVLVIFDLDNTLLRFRGDFGSEQWFMWQRELIEKGSPGLPSATDSVDHLLDVQSWIYNVTPMELVDTRERDWIYELRNRGTPVIALTSRSLSVHDATLRELHNNFLPLVLASELALEGEGQIYLPYNLEHPEESGLSFEDISKFKLGAAKQVLFDQGVFFTQGQHKGAMLKTLLTRMGRQFKAVVFIDDRNGHIEAMRAMASSIPHDVYSVHFNLSETWTAPFFQGSKADVQQDWCRFAEWLNVKWFPNPEARIYRSCPP